MSCPQYKNNKIKNVKLCYRKSNLEQVGERQGFLICSRLAHCPPPVSLTPNPVRCYFTPGFLYCLQAEAHITLYNYYLLLCLKQQNSKLLEGLEGLTESQLSVPWNIFSNLQMSTSVPEFPYYGNLSVVIALHYSICLNSGN